MKGKQFEMFLHECSDHLDQLFCLFELKKASQALRIVASHADVLRLVTR